MRTFWDLHTSLHVWLATQSVQEKATQYIRLIHYWKSRAGQTYFSSGEGIRCSKGLCTTTLLRKFQAYDTPGDTLT
jgi:hypothetical protein